MKLITTILLIFSFQSHANIIKGFSHESLVKGGQLNLVEQFWLSPAGPFNTVIGVTGSLGVGSSLSPFGGLLTEYFKSLGNWEEFSHLLTDMGGPLSAYGPLVLAQGWFQKLYGENPFLHPLFPGGILHTLGNGGIMNPLGFAGPLGPHGAHGFEIAPSGDYINQDGKVVTELKSEYGTYPLFEIYDELPKKLDTSFMYKGIYQAGEVIKVKSDSDQWVNITIVNSYNLDLFGLELVGTKYQSKLYTITNAINVFVEAGTQLKIKPILLASGHFLSKPYRLIVTGSPGFYSIDEDYHY